MEHTQKYLEKSKHKGYIKHQISNLSDSQKNELENLVIRFENAGAKDPLIWACSEITESIPQFGRFLVLKSLLEIAKSTENNISLAGDFDEDFEEKSKELEEKIGRDKLFDFLMSYSKGIIYNVIELLDEGNPESDRDKISWALMETDESFKLTGKAIQGLHESYLEFENELK